MFTELLMVVQHALALFRTQRIVKIFLELNTQNNKLNAIVSAENGASPDQQIFTEVNAILPLPQLAWPPTIGSWVSLTGCRAVQAWRRGSRYLA